MRNWTRALIVLVFANLVFMAGLEIQRRTIWSEEADYLRKIEAFIISNQKTASSYEYIQRQLKDIDDRVNAVQIATSGSARVASQVKDIQDRIMHIEQMQASPPPPPAAPAR